MYVCMFVREREKKYIHRERKSGRYNASVSACVRVYVLKGK